MKIPVINGLRGIAICSVVMHHLFFADFLYGKGESHSSAIIQLFMSSGWLGVDIFFILSGLVLYLPYAKNKRFINKVEDFLPFYKHRFLRLFPLYWFISLISLVFMAHLGLNDPKFYHWFLALLTVTFPFYYDSFTPYLNSVLWSLGVEIWFSVLFPVIVIVIPRLGWLRLIIPIMAISCSMRIIGYLHPFHDIGAFLNVTSDSVLGRLDEFVAGMFLAQCIANPSMQQRFTRIKALIGTICILITFMCWEAWYHLELPVWSAAFYAWIFIAGWFLVIGYLVSSHSLISKVIEVWPLQLLGMMCYSIYLWHGIILQTYNAIHKVGHGEYFTYISIVLLISGFTYRYIEFGNERDMRKLLPT